MESNPDFMVVRICFGRGPLISLRNGKNSRIAILAATLVTMVAISFASLGLWGVGADLGWAGDFVISKGFLSHWQVWIGAAVVLQYAALLLKKYAEAARTRDMEASREESPGVIRVAANI